MPVSEHQKVIAKRSYWKRRDKILASYDKEKARWQRIKSVYGITKEQWEAIFSAQGNCCAICKRSDLPGRNWATDHDHITGEIRGILCHKCNTTIGRLGDNVEEAQKLLHLILEYLK